MNSDATPSPLIPATLVQNVSKGRRQSNLAFALAMLPSDRRKDALTFYDFCRVVDDIADAPGMSVADRRAALDAWRGALLKPNLTHLLPTPLAALIARYNIDSRLMVAIVDGVACDIEPDTMADFTALQDYCWHVASAVGLVSIRIFGIPSPHGKDFAELLGVALQLTNIIRDVGDDADAGRIYLPDEDLARFAVSRDDILARRSTPEFSAMMEFQIQRAREFYFQAFEVRPRDWKKALRPADLMARTYLCLLGKIESDGCHVLDTRYRLTLPEKLWLMAGGCGNLWQSGSSALTRPRGHH